MPPLLFFPHECPQVLLGKVGGLTLLMVVQVSGWMWTLCFESLIPGGGGFGWSHLAIHPGGTIWFSLFAFFLQPINEGQPRMDTGRHLLTLPVFSHTPLSTQLCEASPTKSHVFSYVFPA